MTPKWFLILPSLKWKVGQHQACCILSFTKIPIKQMRVQEHLNNCEVRNDRKNDSGTSQTVASNWFELITCSHWRLTYFYLFSFIFYFYYYFYFLWLFFLFLKFSSCYFELICFVFCILFVDFILFSGVVPTNLV